jgi:hypothetical protein
MNNIQENTSNTNSNRKPFKGIGIIMGIAIGAAIGAATDNLAVWVGVGVAIGVGLERVMYSRNKSQSG